VRTRPELRDVRLADRDRPGGAHALDDQVVDVRDVLAHDRRAERGADAGGEMGVLVRHRQTVQRADRLSGGQALVRRGGRGHGPLRHERDDRVQPRVHRVDAVQVGLHELAGRDLAAAQRGGHLAGGEVAEVVHVGSPISRAPSPSSPAV
jgi:hypothetical protein